MDLIKLRNEEGTHVNTITRILTATAILLLAACSSAKPGDARPEWVNGNSSQYPAATYLTGHGQADNMAAAKDRARADLAKNFSVNVSDTAADSLSRKENSAPPLGLCLGLSATFFLPSSQVGCDCATFDSAGADGAARRGSRRGAQAPGAAHRNRTCLGQDLARRPRRRRSRHFR